jgi:methylase of polypeptide subunit release factors
MSNSIQGKRFFYDNTFVLFLNEEIEYVGLQNKNNLIRAINFLYHAPLDLDTCSNDEIQHYLQISKTDYLTENTKIASRTLEKFSAQINDGVCNVETLHLLAEGLYYSRYMGIKRFTDSKADAYALFYQKLRVLDQVIPVEAYAQLDNTLTESMQLFTQHTALSDLSLHYLKNTLNIFSDPALFVGLYHSYNSHLYLERILSVLHLRVVVAGPLSEIEYITPQSRLVVPNAQLLWDCNCHSPRLDGLSAEAIVSRCPIHGKAAEEVVEDISHAFGTQDIEIAYKEGRYLWKNGYLWPPSVDSFILIQQVLDYIAQNELQPSTVLDIGSGTGFLGIELARSVSSIHTVKLSDFSSTAVLYSTLNIMLNRASFSGRQVDIYSAMEFNGVGIHAYHPVQEIDEFDLLVCNPPYIPIKDEYVEERKHNAISGLTLLKWVLEAGPKMAKHVIVSFSNIADHEIFPFAEKKGIVLTPIGQSHTVPFRVPAMFRNEGFFAKEIRPYLQEIPNSTHYFYHDITAYLVTV